jgi:transcriptional regulator GlxA family with amidase domain
MRMERFFSELEPVAASNDVASRDAKRSGSAPVEARKARSTDPRIQRVLDALASRPSEKWTVLKLARMAGLSRAAFARRFAEEVGTPPLRYLTSIRIRHASELLTSTDSGLAAIAIEVGYANEFALSRAFRRLMHEAPSTYRRRALLPSPKPSIIRLAA